MADAGRYDLRVIVQKPTETRDDRGGLSQTWSQHTVQWMGREDITGSESFAADQAQAQESAVFRTHYTRGISPKMRLLVPGKTTTLATGIDDGSGSEFTTVKVASADGFPLEGKYHIRIGSELAQVNSGQGTTTWTVERGMDGTTAASATQGTSVSHMEVYGIGNARGDNGRRVETVISARGIEPLG